MIRGLYSAASCLECALLNQDVVAENLAHANVAGYRRRGLSFETFESSLATADVASTNDELRGAKPGLVYDHFDPGPAQATGRALDLLPTGDTWFVLDGPNGPLFTRNGQFQLNERREIISANGLRVRGEGGAITIPEEATRIGFGNDGSVLADGVQIGRLQLIPIKNPIGMRRVGTTLFEGAATPLGQPEIGSVGVEQGFLEGSNVQVVTEMVNMIAGLRHYEAAQRALRSISEVVALGTRPLNG